MRVDLNSLIPGDVSLVNWRTIDSANAPNLLSGGGAYGGSDASQSAVYVNPGGISSGTARLACYAGIPSGVSSVSLAIRAARPTGVGSSTLGLELRTAAGALVGGASIPLSASMTTYAAFSATVAWPTEYVVNCYLNSTALGSSANAQAMIEWIALRPSTYSAGTWRSDLNRVELSPELIQGGYSLFAYARYWSRPSIAPAIFQLTLPTSDPVFYYQQYCNNAASNGNGCPVFFEGRFRSSIMRSTGTSAVPVWDFVPVTVPTDDISRRSASTVECLVEIDSAPLTQASAPGWTLPASVLGTFPTAIYVPLGSHFEPVARSTQREAFVLYGDSIGAGIGVTTPEYQGTSQMLRRVLPYDFVSECAGGRSLQGDIQQQTYQQLAAQLAKSRPRVLWTQVGTNDYGGAGSGTGSVASWQTLLTSVLTTLRALVPDMTIFVQSITSRTFEGANAFGDTAAQYRTAASNAATAAGTYCQFVDASAWINPATQTSDGLHLNEKGQAIAVSQMMSTLQTARLL